MSSRGDGATAATLTGRILVRQVSLYGVFTIIRRGLNVAFTPIYTHYMSPGDYGILEILNLGAWLASIIGMCKSTPRSIATTSRKRPTRDAGACSARRCS